MINNGIGVLKPRMGFAFVSFVWLSLFVLRLLVPSDLGDNDQERPAAYVLDAVRNGNWICQRDYKGEIMSKPPLCTWLQALATLPFGRGNLFSLYLPNALAVLLTSWLLFGFGGAVFGREAGFLAALMYLLSTSGLKQIAFARTDPLFTFLIALAALFAFRARLNGKGWVMFWLVGAGITLTKGPLGLILAAGGLLGLVRLKTADRPSRRMGHVTGVALLVLITGGWFLLAYLACGQDLIDKMLRRELVGHVTGGYKNVIPGSVFYKPALYFITRFFPWSLLACVGFWRAWKRPAQPGTQRAAERFLLASFLVGLGLLSLSPHQRGDLVFPLLPAAALVAGRELARVLPARSAWLSPRRLMLGFAACLLVLAVYYNTARVRHPKVARTGVMRELARAVEQRAGDNFPLVYADIPYSAQFFLNSMRPHRSLEDASRLLAGSEAVFVATREPDKIRALCPPTAEVHEVLRVARDGTAPAVVLGNRSALKRPEGSAAASGAKGEGATASPVGIALLALCVSLVLGAAARKTLASAEKSAGW